jgi:hypothetical protein
MHFLYARSSQSPTLLCFLQHFLEQFEREEIPDSLVQVHTEGNGDAEEGVLWGGR